MKQYRKRIVDQVLKDKLDAKGAVLIEGARGSGKTTTASHITNSFLYVQDPAKKEQIFKMAELNPSLLLKGDTPRLVDEFNQFILTGSSVPLANMSTSHTGTGRISRMLMRPMTLHESGDTNGSVSLKNLFKQQDEIAVRSDLTLRNIAYVICRGGWPKAIDQTEKIALRQAYDYYDAVVETDIAFADGVSRNPQRVKLLMHSYSRYIASDAKVSSIRAGMISNETDTLSDETVYSYLNDLKEYL